MNRRDFLEKWGLSSLKINLGLLDAEFAPKDPDRAAAWELYIELLTRVALQPCLRRYAKALADIAGVEDLTNLEQE